MVLLGFAAFVVFLIVELDAGEIRWTRLAWLFASVEAIAFGAAGALFGSSIQRSRAENAEAEAKENATAAANGRALAEVLKADHPDEPAGRAGLESFGGGQPHSGTSELARRHAELAAKLFP